MAEGSSVFIWGRSSAGRAVGSQSTGQGFDPPRLHKKQKEVYVENLVDDLEGKSVLSKSCTGVA